MGGDSCLSGHEFESINFRLTLIDAVNQGNWSLSIKLRLECFVIVE